MRAVTGACALRSAGGLDCLQLGWMLSVADVIGNVVPAAFGINVAVG